MTTTSSSAVPMVWLNGIDMTLPARVARFRYKPGWRAWVEQQQAGMMQVLHVVAWVPNSSEPDQARMIEVEHTFGVPVIWERGFDWDRWLLDRCLDVERHEACEWFELAGRRVFYPEHGPGAALYDIRRAP